MEPEGFKYLAFISYSRADNERHGRAWADWMMRLIESFPLEGVHRKVFLDRETLPAGRELSPMLEDALKESKFLILLCSHRSADRPWVLSEIEYFKKHRGIDYIIPVVISGNNVDEAKQDHWISAAHLDIAERTYADFRTRERQRNNTDLIEEGWTSPAAYRKFLAKRKAGSKGEIETWAAAYEDRHKVARFSVLSQLFGKSPQELERIEREHESGTAIERLRRKSGVLTTLLLIAGVAIWIAVSFERKARREQMKAEREKLVAERSLLLIGDAHENSTRMISEVLADLRSKLNEGGQAGLLDDARKIIDESLSESIPPGDGDDSLHMRAVVMDSRAYLARCSGELSLAMDLYRQSLDLREILRRREPDHAMYLHNLSVSHDNLGDCHVLMARSATKSARSPNESLKLAESEYRESIAISRKLVTAPSAAAQWKHDLAVGLFKLGDTLLNRDDEDFRLKAVDELKDGMAIAQQLAESDRSYPKWQAHLGLFCLELGRIHALAAEDEAARGYFLKGRKAFIGLRDRKQLIRQYGDWLKEIENCLKALG